MLNNQARRPLTYQISQTSRGPMISLQHQHYLAPLLKAICNRLVRLLPVALMGVAGTCGVALGSDVIGRVKSTQGNVFIISDGISIRAEPGSLVRAQDTLITGSRGSVGVTLRVEHE